MNTKKNDEAMRRMFHLQSILNFSRFNCTSQLFRRHNEWARGRGGKGARKKSFSPFLPLSPAPYQSFHRPIIFLLLLALLFPIPSQAKVVERIVAIVNDDVITKSELDFVIFNRERELIQIYKFDRPQVKEKLQQEQNQLLDQMIRNHLLIQEARKKRIEISEDEINEAINRIKQLQNINSDKEFESALSSEGYTLYSFREETKKRLKLERLIAQEIGSKLEITNSDIEKFYEENREQFPDKISLNDSEKAQIREFLLDKRLKEELDKYTSQLKDKAFIKIMLDNNPEKK